jgi:alkylation response protein AidB-like acyl-CoA dehydrogenase
VQLYNAPLEDYRFLLETLGYASVQGLPGYHDYDLDTVMSLLAAGDTFCREVALPLNGVGDRVGVRFDPATGSVTLPEGFRSLYARYVENGFAALGHDPAYGGGGAPHTVAVLINEMVTATNKSFSMCPGLSQGLIESIAHHGTDDQRARYLPKLIAGEWTGTMCLTEPQCGTDLGLLSTKAVPDGDLYRLTGTKIWITFGEHDLAENIIHLVLARLPDAPPGIKGISVFVVPRVLPDGTRNNISCSGLEHKMGIHASPTCVMTLDGALGELVGEPHRGMRAMFTMMNVARLNVGLEGVALGDIAYQTAVAFARDRRQGRAPDPEKRERGASADNIMVHPDVRRMLLEVKSTNEAMRALAVFTSLQIDVATRHEDPAARTAAADLAALLTPVVKSYCTERGFLNVSTAMQVCGGSGFTADWSIEQYLRDLRIAMIYEGTNHIQALDLVGRKLPADNGRGYKSWSSRVRAFCAAHEGDAGLVEFVAPLGHAITVLDGLTKWLASGEADGETVGAAASGYLNAFALTALGYMWGLQVVEARARDTKFAAVKVKTARYYVSHVLPEIDVLARVAREGKRHVMAVEPDEF